MKREARADEISAAIHAPRIINHASFPALNALLLLFSILIALQPLTEPDFGWHLRTGLDLIAHGWRLPLTDPYSHTMPDWRWVEHAWLTDGIVGVLYEGLGAAGALGVILFFGSLIVIAFVLASGSASAGWTARLFSVAAALWVALPYLGARTQLVTVLGLALLLRVWHGYTSGQSTHLWWLVPLFFFWANLHGGFTGGLFLLTLILLASISVQLAITRWPMLIRRLDEPVLSWRQNAHVFLALAVAAAVTLANPYGWRLHQEIMLSLTDRLMLDTLHEWQPFAMDRWAGRALAGYLFAVIVALLVGYRRIEPVRWTVLLVLLMLSARHARNVMLLLVPSVPLVAELLTGIAHRVTHHVPMIGRQSKRWLLALTVVIALGMGIGMDGPDHLQRVAQSGLAPEQFFRGTSFPIEAVEWMKTHRDQLGHRMYNDYANGGFLLWWFPEAKIFIDGRMPAWRIGQRWIYYDYLSLTAWDPPALGVLDKYRIDWAIVQRGSVLERLLNTRLHWKPIYEDQKVVILIRT